jgi:hypothetical protein
MGRFYNTSKGNYIDFVYKQPTSLLLKAVQTADAKVDKQIATNADLYGKLHQEALNPDVTKRDEILAGYKQNIDDVAEDIRTNPLDYLGGPSTKIRKLTDDISQNLLRGELAAMGANHTARAKYKEKLEAAVKAKTMSASESAFQLSKYDAEFAHDLKTGKRGTAYKGPSDYRGYTGNLLDENVDFYKYIDEKGSGIMANVFRNEGWGISERGGQKYIVNKSGNQEVVDPKRVQRVVLNAMNNDPKLQAAWGSRQSEGIPGYSEEENMNRKIAGAQYAVDKYAYTKDTRGSSGSADSYGLAGYKHNLKNPIVPVTVTEDYAILANTVGGATNGKQSQEFIDAHDNFVTTLTQGNDKIVNDYLFKGTIYEGSTSGDILKTKDGQGYLFEDGKFYSEFDNQEVDIEYLPKELQSFANKQKKYNTAREEFLKTGDATNLLKVAKDQNMGDAVISSIETMAENHTTDKVNTINNWNSNVSKMAEELMRKDQTNGEYVKKQKQALAEGVSVESIYEDLAKTEVYVAQHVKTPIIKTTDASDLPYEVQNKVDGFLKKLTDNPLTFMLKEGGVTIKHIKGEGNAEAIKLMSASFNDLVANGQFDNRVHSKILKKPMEVPDYENGDEATKIIEVPVMNIQGKDYIIKSEPAMWTDSHIGGMPEGTKYSMKITVYDPENPENKLSTTVYQDGSTITGSDVVEYAIKRNSGSIKKRAIERLHSQEEVISNDNLGDTWNSIRNSNVQVKRIGRNYEYQYKDPKSGAVLVLPDRETALGAVITDLTPEPEIQNKN